MKYNWQQPNWPHFSYDLSSIHDLLLDFAEKTGRVYGSLRGLSVDLQTETMIDFMVAEAVKTSEIEGAYINRQDVMSSVRNNLGLNEDLAVIKDVRALGVAQLMIDVRRTFKQPLTESKLFAWHKMLLADQAVFKPIEVAKWRTHQEPLQIISGPIGKSVVYYEAPASKDVPHEMQRFIEWFNDTAPGGNAEIKFAAVRAAIAHLYFESIHPFEDGNGRIGRAIAEKALSQGLHRPVLLSLSQTLEGNKKVYYEALKNAQRSNEITEWIYYFVQVVLNAQIEAEEQIDFVLEKTKFFDRFKNKLNERQLKVVRRMLQEGHRGFEGGMSAKKYISITGTSKATATRDLQYLVKMNVLAQVGDGRSTRYEINLR